MTRLAYFKYVLGFEASTVLDIGAHVGGWSSWVRASLYPEAKYLLLEANRDKERALKETGLPYQIVLLAARQNASVLFHRTTRHAGGNNTGASIFREQTMLFLKKDKYSPELLPSKTLDRVVAETRSRGCCDLVKLDVEGAEIEVLKGGPRTLRRAKLVALEVAVLPYNRGAPTFAEVAGFMSRRGFEIVDIADSHLLPSGRLFKLDVLFAPRGSRFLDFRPGDELSVAANV